MTRSLPPHPSLEHLKKEAKALLRDHKQGRSEVYTRLRHLRRFAQAIPELSTAGATLRPSTPRYPWRGVIGRRGSAIVLALDHSGDPG
jgi:hypothetical protein